MEGLAEQLADWPNFDEEEYLPLHERQNFRRWQLLFPFLGLLKFIIFSVCVQLLLLWKFGYRLQKKSDDDV